MRRDVAVLGSGPAGLALAHALGRSGLSTTLIAPNPDAAWTANYGAWDDEVSDPRWRAQLDESWAAPTVFCEGEAERLLDRRYVRFSTPGLQRALREGAAEVGVEEVQATVAEVEHHDLGTTLRLQDGQELEVAVAVDATGARSRFLQRVSDAEPAWQVAYGELVEVDGHPWEQGEMVLMDWRSLPGSGPNEPATFLYALPLGRNLVFVEETSLAARPGVALSTLGSRLHRRLRHQGIHVRAVLGEERCRIPMGIPLPRRDQRLLAFGTAAGMVHPATGYQLARALAEAEPLALAVATGLAQGPEAASERAWRTLWPRERVLQWELYGFGTSFLCGLSAAETRAFFAAFFSLEPALWQGFVSGTLGVAGVARAMAEVFARLDAPLRFQLMRAGATGPSVFLKAAFAS